MVKKRQPARPRPARKKSTTRKRAQAKGAQATPAKAKRAKSAKAKSPRRKSAPPKGAPPKSAPRKRASPTRVRPAPAAAAAEMDLDDRFRSTAAGCLDQEVATEVVFSCIPNGAVPLDTALGTLFGEVARRGFCGCVFDQATAAGATIREGDIPCTALSTVGDVIDAISC